MIVYCSIPAINRRDSTLSEIKDLICLPHVTMNYMTEYGNYMIDRVRQADVLIVMHKNNEFDFLIDSLTDTVKKDVEEAKRLGKKIYLAYRTSNGSLNIYDTIIGDYQMRGVPGSSKAIGIYLKDNNIDKFISQSEDQYKEQQKHVVQIDKQSDTKYEEALAQVGNKVSIEEFSHQKPKYDRRLLI